MSKGLKTATLCMVLMATAAVAQPQGRDDQQKPPQVQAHGGQRAPGEGQRGQGGGQRGPGEGQRGQGQAPGGPGAARANGGDRAANPIQSQHTASPAAQPNPGQHPQGSPLQRNPDNGARRQAYQGPTNRPQPGVPEPSRAGPFGGGQDRGGQDRGGLDRGGQDRGVRSAGQHNAGPNRGADYRGPGGNHQFVYQGRPHDVIRRSGFRYPSGYSYRRWGIGQSLPMLFLGSSYYFSDYVDYGFGPPPRGCVWVRYGPDLLLVDRRTGRIRDVIYGVFYDY